MGQLAISISTTVLMVCFIGKKLQCKVYCNRTCNMDTVVGHWTLDRPSDQLNVYILVYFVFLSLTLNYA